MSEFGHSSYAEQQRTLKAMAIEEALLAAGIPTDAARTLPPASRRRIERAAGVRRSSDETWDRAFAFLTDRETARRTPTPAHPG